VEISVSRADSRHREGQDDCRARDGLGGRFIPAEMIRAQADPEWGSRNRKTFEEVKALLDRWYLFDNSGPTPVLIQTERGRP
jgi:predicted ABC-type ATPase